MLYVFEEIQENAEEWRAGWFDDDRVLTRGHVGRGQRRVIFG
jgi:hypothetical protein